LKRFLRILRNTLLILIGLVVALVLALNLTPVQNWVARQAARILSDKLKTEVRVGSVRIDIRNRAVLRGLYVEDQRGDTLLYAGQAELRLSDWAVLHPSDPITVTYLGLHDTHAWMRRDSAAAGSAAPVWNYQFIVDAFDTGPRDRTKKKNELILDLEKLDLQRVRFRADDAWLGKDMAAAVQSLQLTADEVDLRKRRAAIRSLRIEAPAVAVRQYRGGKPRDTSLAARGPKPIDTTAFNRGGWIVSVRDFQFSNGALTVANSPTPAPEGWFDGRHIGLRDVDMRVQDLRIVGDTVRAQLQHLSGSDRSGFVLKKLAARVSVSPVAAVCEDLVLETPRSRITRYYAMRYRRFPDFTDYVRKVRMEADFRGAKVDSRDVAFFAPALKRTPAVVTLSGKFVGRVDSFGIRGLDAQDGSSRIRGDLSMVGLPDIHNTFIRLTNGSIATTGAAVLRWAPRLREAKGFDATAVRYAAFNGSFVGTIHQFAANGVLLSNLGTIRSDVRMTLPASGAPRYAGTIQTSSFLLGTLLRKPDLGIVSGTVRLDGTGFDPQTAAVRLSGRVGALGFRGYTYTGIQADGVLGRRRFEGKAIVDDPNLALSFDGALDFSGPRPVIQAKAYLLNSDLQALNLTRDSVRLSADFDLSTEGTDLNDFIGMARLYNINLWRKDARVDVDSVVAFSGFDGPVRTLTVESNDVTASLVGTYRLTDLPLSVQRYLGGYLPAYFKAAEYRGADQQVAFDIRTRQVDDLLAVIAPVVRGFNYASVSGTLSTAAQQLEIAGTVGEGRIGPVRLRGVNLSATGDYRRLVLGTTASNLTIGDSFLNAAVQLDAALGADSLRFSLSTTSARSIGTAQLSGAAFARGDTLEAALNPSQIYINGARWDIPAGNRAVLGPRYLLIRDFVLQNGAQRIAINSEGERTEQALRADFTALDLSQLSAIAGPGLAVLQPGGTISGTARVEELFGKPSITADLRGSALRLGTDTLGDAVVKGYYDGGTRVLTLEDGSGIFRGDASLTVQGNLSTDSTRRALQGTLTLNNAPVRWGQPFIRALASNLSGTMNGTLTLSGSPKSPDVEGRVTLADVGFRVDYLGTVYRIPEAAVDFSNYSLEVGRATLLDREGNTAVLTGRVRHNRFKAFRFALDLQSDKFEAMNLRDSENPLFYGRLLAKAHMRITGPLENLRMDIDAEPAGPSQLFLPIGATGTAATYSFVSFKQYGDTAALARAKPKNKLSIYINAIVNPQASISMILDPAAGDAINATGNGSLNIEIPAVGDIKMYGNYDIEQGDYTFTLRQVAFQRRFIINSGSRILFNGPIAQTGLDVNATYPTTGRLADLLTTQQRTLLKSIAESELENANRPQRIDLILSLRGTLDEPQSAYRIELPERISEGTFAYARLQQLNNDERSLFEQVASLLLIGSFLPPEGQGLTGSTARVGAFNNLSQILSGTASGQVTNLVNRILRDDKLAVDLKYRNYSAYEQQADGSLIQGGGATRNELRIGLRRNFFKDRLVLEVGSAYDWGRPVSTSTNRSNFNALGDFRAQYLLTPGGSLRLSLFNTANYDVIANGNITRRGAGISYRRTFDSFAELIGRTPRAQMVPVPVSVDTTPLPTDIPLVDSAVQPGTPAGEPLITAPK